MTVWEKCNEVKGANLTDKEWANWALEKGICPIRFDVELGIDIPRDKYGFFIDGSNGFDVTARKVCDKFRKCSFNCLLAYLNSEFIEE